jgi:altronate dehydratase large subunit
VDRTVCRIEATGADPRGTQPTPGNIEGGLSTLEEKSLGGVRKTGTTPIVGVFPWGSQPKVPGLHLMDCPANVPQLLLGWAAAGAQLLVFSVGGGLPSRIPSLIGTNAGPFPLMPVIKVLSNPQDWKARSFFDVYAGGILEERSTLESVADSIWESILASASGTSTYLETYAAPAVQTWEMLVRGPTI